MLAFCVTVMTHGLLSLALDRDVIPEPGSNALVVIGMFAPWVAIIFITTLSALTPERRGRPAPGIAAIAGVAAYALGPAGGALAYSIVTGRLLAFGHFLVSHLLSPFVLATAIIAALTILALPLLEKIRSRPR